MAFSIHLQVFITLMAALAVSYSSEAFPANNVNGAGNPSRPWKHSGYFVKPPAASMPKSVEEFVDGHNQARASVGVPPVTWNATVAAYAEAYAAERSGDCEMEHSDGPYGENIAEGYGELHASDAVNMWAGEKPYYDYASNSCVGGEECLHYTQVVWRATTSIGCARASCRNGWMFVTCNYYPPGNYIGERPY